MYSVGFAATVMMLLIQFILHIRWLKIMKEVSGEVIINLSSSGLTVDLLREKLKEIGVQLRTFTIIKGKDGELRLSAHISFSAPAADNVMEWMKEASYVETMTVYMV